MLSHIGNKVASVSVTHSVQLSKIYETMKNLFQYLKYDYHRWIACGDLTVPTNNYNIYDLLKNQTEKT